MSPLLSLSIAGHGAVPKVGSFRDSPMPCIRKATGQNEIEVLSGRFEYHSYNIENMTAKMYEKKQKFKLFS